MEPPGRVTCFYSYMFVCLPLPSSGCHKSRGSPQVDFRKPTWQSMVPVKLYKHRLVKQEISGKIPILKSRYERQKEEFLLEAI